MLMWSIFQTNPCEWVETELKRGVAETTVRAANQSDLNYSERGKGLAFNSGVCNRSVIFL